MKCDDDVLYNITDLHQTVLQHHRKQCNYSSNYVSGLCMSDKNVSRSISHRWGVSKTLYKPERYPSHCNGPNYVITRSSIPLLLNQTKYIPTIHIEDAFIGILAQRAGNVTIVNIPKWTIEWKARRKPEEYREYHTIHTGHQNMTIVEKLWADVYSSYRNKTWHI